LVIKYYLKQKFLNNSWSGGIGSYTLVIMIISYLQLHAKQQGETSETTLADHLLGFFGLYGSQFDYVESVISIVNEGKYLRKSEKNWKNENNPSLLSVEDPHNPDNDVGCIAFKIESAKEAFFHAYNLLAETKSQQSSSSASSEDESRKSFGDFSCSQPDLNVSQLMWVNYSLQCFRARIKSIYRSCDVEASTCPIHPTTKGHSSLTLSSTRYFNNGTKPHKHKSYGPSKENNKRLSKKANSNNNNNNNNNNNHNNNHYNHNTNNNNHNHNHKNSISFHMDELNSKNRPWQDDPEDYTPNNHNHNHNHNQRYHRQYKIVSTDFPGLAKNVARELSYDGRVESPSI